MLRCREYRNFSEWCRQAQGHQIGRARLQTSYFSQVLEYER